MNDVVDAFDAVVRRHGRQLDEALVAAVAGDGLLERAARYHLATGGKRLRALLPIWVCESLGGRGEDALPIGVGFELLHNATLVHDDLQDGDALRRGAPAVWTRWGAAQAINVGNALFFRGLDAMTEAPSGPSLLPAAFAAMLEIVAGQALEFQLQLPRADPDHVPATLESWTRMASGKTAALFAVCVRGGVHAAGGDASACEAGARFGRRLGLLFQVQDDLLDLVGDKGRDQRATDIAEGKVSYPVAWLADNHQGPEVDRLLAIVRAPRAETSPAMIAEALELLGRLGAIDATATYVRDEAAHASADPLASALPGLITRVLEPVRHAL